MNAINNLYHSVINFWAQTDMTSKVLICLIVGLFILNFWYAFSTGIWFMNPFNPLTWKGAYLQARVVYGLITFTVSILMGVLIERIN